jgi:regulator of replication initiation timing
MTELSLRWKQIFDKISQSDEHIHITGEVDYYNLASILEELCVENAELKERIEKLEKWKNRAQNAAKGVGERMDNRSKSAENNSQSAFEDFKRVYQEYLEKNRND